MDPIDGFADEYAAGTEKPEEKYFILLCKTAERYQEVADTDIGTMLQALRENLEA